MRFHTAVPKLKTNLNTYLRLQIKKIRSGSSFHIFLIFIKKYKEIIQGVSKKMDLLYLFNISGTKKQISKPFFSSEN